jgi:hypothetical protein
LPITHHRAAAVLKDNNPEKTTKQSMVIGSKELTIPQQPTITLYAKKSPAC